MRCFDYNKLYNELLNADIVALLTQIHELKGKQGLVAQAQKYKARMPQTKSKVFIPPMSALKSWC